MSQELLKPGKVQLREEFGRMYKSMVDPAERAKKKFKERRKEKVKKLGESYGL